VILGEILLNVQFLNVFCREKKKKKKKSTIFKTIEEKNLLLELVFTNDEFQLKLVSFLKEKKKKKKKKICDTGINLFGYFRKKKKKNQMTVFFLFLLNSNDYVF
jgi:hypothetical protein